MPLTDLQVKAAKPKEKPYKLADSKGLHLFVTPAGSKSWRLKYRINGKEKRLTFGCYPDVKLTEARDLRDEALKAKRAGLDPAIAKRQAQAARARAAADTFEKVAREWHASRKPGWSPRHGENVLKSLQDEAFPKIGHLPLESITAPLVLEVLRPIESRGAVEQAHRVRQRISDVFVFAISTGLAQIDPASMVKKALRPVTKRNYPALISLSDARALLADSEEAPGFPLTKLAARLLALTAARSEPLRYAEPHEFEGLDSSEPIWRIPASKMKLSHDQRQQEVFEFIIPLAPASVEIVKMAMEHTRGGPYLFPSLRHAHKPMSENSLSIRYRRLPKWAGRHVPHGWRTSFSTIMNERAMELGRGEDRAIIDLMLAHKPEGVEAIYNRAAFMPRRREIAKDWAELLLSGLPSNQSLLIGKRR
jgi:integrase